MCLTTCRGGRPVSRSQSQSPRRWPQPGRRGFRTDDSPLGIPWTKLDVPRIESRPSKTKLHMPWIGSQMRDRKLRTGRARLSMSHRKLHMASIKLRINDGKLQASRIELPMPHTKLQRRWIKPPTPRTERPPVAMRLAIVADNARPNRPGGRRPSRVKRRCVELKTQNLKLKTADCGRVRRASCRLRPPAGPA